MLECEDRPEWLTRMADPNGNSTKPTPAFGHPSDGGDFYNSCVLQKVPLLGGVREAGGGFFANLFTWFRVTDEQGWFSYFEIGGD